MSTLRCRQAYRFDQDGFLRQIVMVAGTGETVDAEHAVDEGVYDWIIEHYFYPVEIREMVQAHYDSNLKLRNEHLRNGNDYWAENRNVLMADILAGRWCFVIGFGIVEESGPEECCTYECDRRGEECW